MKAIIILSVSLALTWLVISLLQPKSGSISLDENTLKALQLEAKAQKILFSFSIVFGSLLCYKLYKITANLNGLNNHLVKLLCAIIFGVTIVSLVILFVGITAYWL